MGRNVPKNIRQIGRTDAKQKIYIEDYVITYLEQLSRETEDMQSAFLVGEMIEEEHVCYTYVYGAVRTEEPPVHNENVEISDAQLKDVKRKTEEYFPDGVIIGWFLSVKESLNILDIQLMKQHEKLLDKKNSILLLKESGVVDETIYLYRDHEFHRQNGYYIYYEKNPSMQNYLIDQKRGVSIENRNVVTDEAAKNFRQILNQKSPQKPSQIRRHRMSYALSTILVLSVLAIGVGRFNDYEGLNGIRDVISASSRLVNTKSGYDLEESVQIQSTLESTIKTDEPDKMEQPETVTDNNIEEKLSEPEEATPVEENKDNYYVIQKGDTLAGISRKYYGTIRKVDEICRVNQITNVNLIIEGQKIILP